MTAAGHRPQLCLLPGLDGTGRLYAPLLEALDGGYAIETLAYDGTCFDGYASLAETLEPALQRHASVVLVAESFAGPLAVLLAHRNPGRVRAVVLAASFVHRPLPCSLACAAVLERLPAIAPPVSMLERLLAGAGLPSPLRAEFDAILDDMPVEVMRRRALAALRVDVRRELAALDMPVLYLQARHDRLVLPRAGREIVDVARRARHVAIDAPHFLFQLAPGAAAEAMTRFLQANRIGTPREAV